MQGSITYYRKNKDIECIYYQNSTQSYPVHTHSNHITLGYLMDGEVRVMYNGREFIYYAGEDFCVMPDVPHAVEPVDGMVYSMISICVPMKKMLDEQMENNSSFKYLKKIISEMPEHTFLIEDMAHKIGVSPYHMIRRFKQVCGLTPHQFQIQCRIRKSQKLLEEGMSVTEAAYAAGFCDQSHFDRCFRKVVRLTPSEYKLAVKRFL